MKIRISLTNLSCPCHLPTEQQGALGCSLTRGRGSRDVEVDLPSSGQEDRDAFRSDATYEVKDGRVMTYPSDFPRGGELGNRTEGEIEQRNRSVSFERFLERIRELLSKK